MEEVLQNMGLLNFFCLQMDFTSIHKHREGLETQRESTQLNWSYATYVFIGPMRCCFDSDALGGGGGT